MSQSEHEVVWRISRMGHIGNTGGPILGISPMATNIRANANSLDPFVVLFVSHLVLGLWHGIDESYRSACPIIRV